MRRVCSRGGCACHPGTGEGTEGIMGRTSLLGEHVLDEVAHAVTVAELVVVPAEEPRGKYGISFRTSPGRWKHGHKQYRISATERWSEMCRV